MTNTATTTRIAPIGARGEYVDIAHRLRQREARREAAIQGAADFIWGSTDTRDLEAPSEDGFFGADLSDTYAEYAEEYGCDVTTARKGFWRAVKRLEDAQDDSE